MVTTATATTRREAVLARLERHVRMLAEAGGIDVELSATRRARAFRASPSRGRRAAIVVPPIRGQVSYFVALHELGHLLSPGNRSLRQLEREADAWRFALDRALVHPTPATARSLARDLESYLLRAQRRAALGYRTVAIIPGPESFFWAVRARLHALAERA